MLPIGCIKILRPLFYRSLEDCTFDLAKGFVLNSSTDYLQQNIQETWKYFDFVFAREVLTIASIFDCSLKSEVLTPGISADILNLIAEILKRNEVLPFQTSDIGLVDRGKCTFE